MIKYKIHRFLVKHNIIKGSFLEQGFIYVVNGEPTNEPVDCVKWLDEISLHCYYKEKNKKCFDILNEKYPQYKGFINLF